MPHPLSTLPSLVFLLLACSSSAPYAITAAALNSGVGLGAAAAQRASGGCYAMCTNGTVCNPRTGFCERDRALDACDGAAASAAGCERNAPGLGVEEANRAGAAGGLTPVLGVSPATGRAPPPPGQRPTADAP